MPGTGNPNAAKIPASNVLSLPAMLAASGNAAMEMAYSYQPSGMSAAVRSSFVGSFCRKNDDMPSWARDYAQWDYENFLKNTPGKLKRYSDIDSQLAAGDALDYLNYVAAWDMWDKDGRVGPEPYTTQQDYGSCVDASTTELLTALLGYRASIPANRERFTRPAAWYFYANRGYCGDGWYFGALAAVAMQTGMALRQPYTYGSKSVDFTGDDQNEQVVARTWCRGGIPDDMEAITRATMPFEDGAFVEFDSSRPMDMLKVFAAGGGFNTGGTNTSGGHKPYTVGRVGGHEQSSVGALNSEAWRKFSQDTIGVKLADDDFAVVMNQTWGAGFSGEVGDQYWPSWLGHKPQGAWIWKMSDIIRYFRGDIWCVLPRFKGVPDPNPQPVPPGPGPSPTPGPTLIDVTVNGTVAPGQYVLVPKTNV